ncbi:MAG: DDE-type integrase/transposase/recombinase [Candidatus Heimdallarchaeaceae archaeon]
MKISHTTIWKVLKQEGEKSWRKKTKKVKARKRFERKKPNELWQIDIKGPIWCEEQLPEGQHLYLLTIIDDHSRFMIGTKFYTRPVKNQDILSELHKAISKYGKPIQTLTDNGSQFYAVKGGTSTITRWCMQEDIEHIRSRVFHPQTCGKVERTHVTIVREFKRLGLPFCHLSFSCYYLDYYNFFRPHQGINLLTP